ncbi:unnamed protein product [Rotaria sp. Silwood1]|nr:unnamed protein product [Rotaria sp. Silwood1]
MHASQKYQGYMKIGEVLHVEGPYICLQALRKAVKKLQERHPTLRSRLQRNPQKANSYFLEEDETLELKIIEIERKRCDHLTFWKKEWRQREKSTTAIGQGLAELWLLQDPQDKDDISSPREIVFICEHSICDALSLSNAAHELLIGLSHENHQIFAKSLDWPITMETAIRTSLSRSNRTLSLVKLIIRALSTRVTTSRSKIAKIPLGNVDIALGDMANLCHTETCYAILNKEQTQQLIDKCRQEKVTITSTVCSAILCAINALINADGQAESSLMELSMTADTRRRYVPPIGNHDLCNHVSSMIPFVVSTRDMLTRYTDLWQLARTFGGHTKKCIDDNQILALGIIIGRMFSKSLNSPKAADFPTCGISSWGILTFDEQYGQWKFEGMTPIINMVQGFMPFITIQTVNGILSIMFSGPHPVIPFNVLEQLRQSTIDKLLSLL